MAYYAYFFQAKRGRSRFRKQVLVWGGEADARCEKACDAIGMTRLWMYQKRRAGCCWFKSFIYLCNVIRMTTVNELWKTDTIPNWCPSYFFLLPRGGAETRSPMSLQLTVIIFLWERHDKQSFDTPLEWRSSPLSGWRRTSAFATANSNVSVATTEGFRARL